MNYSVLMSVYDKKQIDYLIQRFESMLGQTVKAEQFVIVEDGILNDKLQNIILSYKKDMQSYFNCFIKTKCRLRNCIRL